MSKDLNLIEAIARGMCVRNAQYECVVRHSCTEATCTEWRGFGEEARAALLAIEQSGTHVVVPVEPTDEMRNAGTDNMPVEYDLRMMESGAGEEYPRALRSVVVGFARPKDRQPPENVYRAMLAARPKGTTA